MIAYVLTMPKGRLKNAFNLSRWNLCSDYMHLKNLREGNRKRAQSSFLLPANLLPWNVSPKKKAQVTLSVKRKT